MIVSLPSGESDTLLSRPATGPRGLEGRAAPRARLLRHTLTAQVAVPEDRAAILERGKDWLYSLNPQTRFQGWIMEQVAVTTLRIDREQRIERRLRDRACLRAETCWDADRRSEVEIVGAGLADHPAEVVDRLRKSLHGCDWLIKRWAMLARAADLDGSWTPEQMVLAHQMLGTPAEFRSGDPSEVVDAEGRPIGSPLDLAALARRESAGLMALRQELAALDDVDRALAESDHPVGESPELRRVRRHQATLNHHLRWLLKQVGVEPEPSRPAPHLEGYFDAEVKPVEQPTETRVAEAQPVPAGRREARARKVEARRRAAERKLDRLRT